LADTGTAYESGVGRGATAPYTATTGNTAFTGVSAEGNVLGNDTPGTGGTVASYTKADGTGSTNAGVDLIGTYGTLNIASTGGYTYAVDNGNTTVQSLLPGDTLTETFRYRVTNSAPGTNWSTLTITLQGTNDAPVAVVDTASTSRGLTSR
jgi:VCBS repeat-containing protein